jgi:hypothetical protein
MEPRYIPVLSDDGNTCAVSFPGGSLTFVRDENGSIQRNPPVDRNTLKDSELLQYNLALATARGAFASFRPSTPEQQHNQHNVAQLIREPWVVRAAENHASKQDHRMQPNDTD